MEAQACWNAGVTVQGEESLTSPSRTDGVLAKKGASALKSDTFKLDWSLQLPLVDEPNAFWSKVYGQERQRLSCLTTMTESIVDQKNTSELSSVWF